MVALNTHHEFMGTRGVCVCVQDKPDSCGLDNNKALFNKQYLHTHI